MKRDNDTVVKNWRQPKYVLLVFLFFILVLIAAFSYLSLSTKVFNLDLKEFANRRITVKKDLIAKRGTIYDSEGNILAINVASYKLIAYLDSSRTTDEENPNHVVDKISTAKTLSEALNAPYEYILERLEKEGVYQVEFGSYGSRLTELQKLAIEELELPGIDFIESSKRFYPNGSFASFTVGYAKMDEDDNIVGELGIESGYNDILKGTNGSLTYQKDLSGLQIPDTPEQRIEAIDGSDIYLTIDENVQRFLETAVKETVEQYTPEWMILVAADPKTGDILGVATSPSFDPNNLPKDMSYQNPLVSYEYEPGSVMKTYTYLCAIDTGNYDGEKTYQSGSYKIGNVTVHDWRENGWGKITYDVGYQYSSNVGSINVAKDYLSAGKLKECLQSYGFGSKTGIELSGEASGALNFNGKIEVDWLSPSYGQGFSTTAIQQIQALTIIANDGIMVKPHIIKKIVNNNTGEVIETKVEKSGQIVKKESVAKMKELMYGAVNNSWAPAHTYAIEGFDIIGKTGTAQIYENGHYLTGDQNYLISFAGMYPKDDPQIIFYAAMKKPKDYRSYTLAPAVKSIVQNIAKYKNINTAAPVEATVQTYNMTSYINEDTAKVEKSLKQNGLNVIVIGDGDTIVNQYPKKGSNVVTGDRIFLVTNGEKRILENVVGWSKNDFITYMDLLKINYEVNGYGYITEQNIEAGVEVNNEIVIQVTLTNKYNLD